VLLHKEYIRWLIRSGAGGLVHFPASRYTRVIMPAWPKRTRRCGLKPAGAALAAGVVTPYYTTALSLLHHVTASGSVYIEMRWISRSHWSAQISSDLRAYAVDVLVITSTTNQATPSLRSAFTDMRSSEHVKITGLATAQPSHWPAVCRVFGVSSDALGLKICVHCCIRRSE
jgi:hypothetical protein